MWSQPPRRHSSALSSPLRKAHKRRNSDATSQSLQLWVEHSRKISARSSVLIAKFNAHHAAAKTEQLIASAGYALPKTSRNRSTLVRSSRLNISRDYDKRGLLRNLRKQKLDLILRREEQARLEKQRAAEAAEAAKQAARRAAQDAQKAAADAAKRAAQQTAQESTKLQENQKPTLALPEAVKQKRTETHAKPLQSATEKQTKTVSFALSSDPASPVEKSSTKLSKSPPSKSKDDADDRDSEHFSKWLPEAQKAWTAWENVSKEADAFRNDYAAKKMRIGLKKQINLGVNQIAASVKQVSIKIQDLSKLLHQVKSLAGPSGEAFTMKEIAQRLIKEADGSVSLNRTAAFAVAAVIVGVSANAPNVERMRDVFLGAFFDHCMYTIPTYKKRRKGETIEEYRTRIGYKEEETAESYLERMCGCVNLFAAVLQTEQVLPRSGFGASPQNPFSVNLGWSWLARIVNIEQKSLTPAIVYAFLETAGYGMAQRFRKQFAKLMAMVQRVVVIGAVKSAPKGPTMRLDLFVSEFVEAGCTIREEPEGRALPMNDAENL